MQRKSTTNSNSPKKPHPLAALTATGIVIGATIAARHENEIKQFGRKFKETLIKKSTHFIADQTNREVIDLESRYNIKGKDNDLLVEQIIAKKLSSFKRYALIFSDVNKEQLKKILLDLCKTEVRKYHNLELVFIKAKSKDVKYPNLELVFIKAKNKDIKAKHIAGLLKDISTKHSSKHRFTPYPDDLCLTFEGYKITKAKAKDIANTIKTISADKVLNICFKNCVLHEEAEQIISQEKRFAINVQFLQTAENTVAISKNQPKVGKEGKDEEEESPLISKHQSTKHQSTLLSEADKADVQKDKNGNALSALGLFKNIVRSNSTKSYGTVSLHALSQVPSQATTRQSSPSMGKK